MRDHRAWFAVLALLACLPANAQNVAYEETFSGLAPPALPVGWVASTGWGTSTASASDGSGGANLVHTGTGAAVATTPTFDLTGHSGASLTYLARRTASYPEQALSVWVSADDGVSWIVMLSGPDALPSASSTWESVVGTLPAAADGQPSVRVRFETVGGGTSGSNIRIDDVRVATGNEGTEPGATLGFSAAESTLISGDESHPVPIRVDIDHAEGLQGVQFEFRSAADSLRFSGLARGQAVADLAAWSVSSETVGSVMRILVLGQSGASLSEGAHDPMLSLLFDGPVAGISDSASVAITITDVVGAVADPTGSDAGLVVAQGRHVVRLVPRSGRFAAPDSIDVGEATSDGPGTRTLRVANPGGARELSVSDVVSGSPEFTITPRAAIIPADGEADFLVTFSPLPRVVGTRSTRLTFVHDGADGPTTTITAYGTARSVRGDVNGDGAVDVADLLVGIDVALGRRSAGQSEMDRLDLHPFLAGDSRIDVRDLTVLVQAILADHWPDGIPLVSGPGETPTGKRSRTDLAIDYVNEGSGVVARLISPVPLRGLQLEWAPARAGTGAQDPLLRPEALQPGILLSGSSERVLLLWANFDGTSIPAGTIPLVRFAGVAALPVPLRYIAMDEQGIRVEMDTHVAVSGILDFETPWPQPFRGRDAGTLNIPLNVPGPGRLDVSVHDMLGRRLWTHGRFVVAGGKELIRWSGIGDAALPIASGTYIIRAEHQGMTASRAISIVR